MTQVLELAAKDIEVFIVTVFYMSQKLSGDIEDIKKTNLEIKIMSEDTQTLDESYGRLDIAEKSYC